ncbi:hypothetical protein [Gluconobacter kondonii]|uniref:hypothetical protein n=1 Tax=Gluconobacter kondonii TaxID=941463 RepID=UPI001B8D5008|nr:hypothetical protein [Gluconobacter kondonii]MBS1054757.1 hypothetical protein [Gluconobacter kondonii]
MSSFKEMCLSLGLDNDDISKAASSIAHLGMSPDDPEAVRVIMDIMLQKRLIDIDASLGATMHKAMRLMEGTAKKHSQNLEKELEVSQTKLASSLENKLVQSVTKAVVKREDNKATINGIFIAVAIVAAFAAGCWAGFTERLTMTGIPFNDMLSHYSPSALLFFGFIAFMLIRVGVGMMCKIEWVRWFLALPPLKKHI